MFQVMCLLGGFYVYFIAFEGDSWIGFFPDLFVTEIKLYIVVGKFSVMEILGNIE